MTYGPSDLKVFRSLEALRLYLTFYILVLIVCTTMFSNKSVINHKILKSSKTIP
jgi:hypothetical protein